MGVSGILALKPNHRKRWTTDEEDRFVNALNKLTSVDKVCGPSPNLHIFYFWESSNTPVLFKDLQSGTFTRGQTSHISPGTNSEQEWTGVVHTHTHTHTRTSRTETTYEQDLINKV